MHVRLRLRHLWLIVPFWGLALHAGLPVGDNSFLWHVRAGIDQLAAGEVIRRDPYSFTRAGAPWRTQSWLADLLYGRLQTWFADLVWVPWFLFATSAAVLGVVLCVLWSRPGAHTGTIVVLVAVGWVIQPYANPRPVIFSLLFFAVVAAIIGTRRAPLWAIPPLMWAWAAVHGSFVVGLGFLALDAVRRRSRRQGAAVALGAVAATFTAHGAGEWRILFDFFGNRAGLAYIQEWQVPDFTHPWLLPFVGLLTLLMAGLAAGRIPPTALWVVAPAVAFALTSTRSVLPAILLLTPWLGDAAGVIPDRPESRSSPVLVWGMVGLFAVSAALYLARPVDVDLDRFPSRDALEAVGAGPVFATTAVGGYLIYLDADPVFIDDRVELYGPDLFERYNRAAKGQEWSDLFGEYRIEQALVSVESSLLLRLAEAGWESCYRDDVFEVVAVACE